MPSQLAWEFTNDPELASFLTAKEAEEAKANGLDYNELLLRADKFQENKHSERMGNASVTQSSDMMPGDF